MGSTDKNFSNTETNGIAERAVRRIKECTSAVLLQSGLDEKWWADSMECYCYLRNVQDLLSDGKTLYEQRFGEPFRGPVIPFGSMMEYHQWKAKGQCTKGNACSFRHHEKKRGKATQSSSPAPNPQTQNDGKSSLKGETLRGRSPSGQRSQRPCKDYLSGNFYESVVCFDGILPNVNITKCNRDANSERSASLCTKRLTV